MAYKPEFSPGENAQMSEILAWLNREFAAISVALNAANDTPANTVLHSEPAKPRDGMTVYADGTNWNPGGGEGFYGRENGAWVKL